MSAFTRVRGLAVVAAAAALLAAAAPGAASATGTAPPAPQEAPAAAPAPPRPAPGGEGAPPAVRTFGSCLASDRPTDLLLLVDQSGSLRDTDPQDVRVPAAVTTLQQLARTVPEGGDVSVAVAGFDAGYEPVADWTRLTEDSVGALTRAVQGFADRDTGIDTDYVTALDGTRVALRERAADGAARCQAVLWFTDGAFDIDKRSDAQAEGPLRREKPYAPGADLTTDPGVAAAMQAGEQELCRAGGLADQLRSTGVLTLAVGLDNAPDGEPVDFGLLERVVTGADRCGQVAAEDLGDLRTADDVDELILDLTGQVPPYPTPTPDRVVCAAAPCEQTHPFVLDASVGSVQVLANADQDGIAVVLTAPSGESVTVAPDQGAAGTTLAGHGVRWEWLTDRTLELELDRGGDAGWAGQWSVVFVDPDAAARGVQARTAIRIRGDLVPAVLEPEQRPLPARRGTPLELRLGIRSQADPEDLVAPEDVLGRAALSASVIDAGGREFPVATGLSPADLAQPVTVDLEEATVGTGTLRLSLAVQTAGVPATPTAPALPGTQLADSTVDLPLAVHADGPTLLADRVEFGRSEGAGPFPATLPVRGPGCVWFTGPTPESVQAAPAEVGTAVTVATDHADAVSCRQLAAGEEVEVPFTLSVPEPGTGTLVAELTAHLAPPDAPERAVEAPLAVVADLVKPADEARRLAVFAAALLLGIGLPLAFLYAANWWSARIPGVPLMAGVLPVTVPLSGTAVRRSGGPLTAHHSDLRFVSVDPRGVRELTVADGVTLRATVSRSPLRPGQVTVSAPGRQVLVGTPDGRLPFAVHNHWVCLVRDPLAEEHGLLLLMAGTAGEEQYAEVAAQVQRDLPGLLRRLRDEQGEAGPEAAPGVGPTGPDGPDRGPFGPRTPGPAPSGGPGPFGGRGPAPAGPGPSVPPGPFGPAPGGVPAGRGPFGGRGAAVPPSGGSAS